MGKGQGVRGQGGRINKKAIRKIIVQERDPWVFEESVFGTYSPDSPEKFEKMFEYDWSLMHPPKLTNEEEEKEVKKMVK